MSIRKVLSTLHERAEARRALRDYHAAVSGALTVESRHELLSLGARR